MSYKYIDYLNCLEINGICYNYDVLRQLAGMEKADAYEKFNFHDSLAKVAQWFSENITGKIND